MRTGAGVKTDLTAVGAPTGIGNDGAVVGSSATTTGSGYHRAANGTVTLIAPLSGDSTTTPTDTENGWVVGASGTDAAPRPFAVQVGGTVVALPTLAGGTGRVADVNGSGIATGWSTTTPGGPHRAVVWDLAAGTVTDIGASSTNATRGNAVSDAGDVVGTEQRPDLPEVCSDEFTPACPASRAFTWTAADGAFTRIEGPDGPVQGIGFGPGGTIVQSVQRSVLQCGGCFNYTLETYGFDPATGDLRLLAPSGFYALDVSTSGSAVGRRITGSGPGTFLEVGGRYTVHVIS